MAAAQKIDGDRRPVIGITADLTPEKYTLGRRYVELVRDCGGTPLILPSLASAVPEYLRLCDGFILSGGDDPRMEQWGQLTHPKAKPIDEARQTFELALLDAVLSRPHHASGPTGSVEAPASGATRSIGPPSDKPVLGICLGMQLMGLHAGGTLDQHLPDSLPTASMHWDRYEHVITGELGMGVVHSHHRQALTDAGSLRVIARSEDGVIEAVRREDRTFYLGVQWHPERTHDDRLGRELIEKLVQAARR